MVFQFHNFPDLYNNLVHIHIICTIYIRDILDTSFIKPSLFIIINFEDPVEGYSYTELILHFILTYNNNYYITGHGKTQCICYDILSGIIWPTSIPFFMSEQLYKLLQIRKGDSTVLLI